MPPCRLPPPSSILADDASSSDHSVDDFHSYSSSYNMSNASSPQTSSQGDVHTQLPGFGALLDSLPESQRTIQQARSPSVSPALQHERWASYSAARGAHVRGDSHRMAWHPYSPPTYHRGFSRSQSPVSEHSEDGPQPRSARPTYTEEEIYFIWYHRDDLQLPWPQILELFNVHFGIRPRNGVQGIQCRYYRALDIHGVPKSRARDRSLPNEHYGVRHYMPEKRWAWMRH